MGGRAETGRRRGGKATTCLPLFFASFFCFVLGLVEQEKEKKVAILVVWRFPIFKKKSAACFVQLRQEG
jgi:hypothetical protein